MELKLEPLTVVPSFYLNAFSISWLPAIRRVHDGGFITNTILFKNPDHLCRRCSFWYTNAGQVAKRQRKNIIYQRFYCSVKYPRVSDREETKNMSLGIVKEDVHLLYHRLSPVDNINCWHENMATSFQIIYFGISLLVENDRNLFLFICLFIVVSS